MSLVIQNVWFQHCELRDEGNNLIRKGYEMFYKGNELNAQSSKFFAKSCKLFVKGHKLIDEGRRLRAKSEKLYRDAVVKTYGHEAVINWTTGEIVFSENKTCQAS